MADINIPKGIIKKIRWTEEDIIFLKQHYKIMKYQDIANHLGRSYIAIRKKALKFKLNSNRKGFYKGNLNYTRINGAWNKGLKGYSKRTLKKYDASKRCIPISKSYLEDLYIQQKLSINKISEKTNFSSTAIYNALKRFNISIKNNNRPWEIKYGKEKAKKMKEKQSEANKREKNYFYGKCKELAPGWKGGLSFVPYTWDFNKKFKEKIRERDNYICQLCGLFENDCIKLYQRRLTIHHIDYDKKNSFPQNCVSLCVRCHSITNFNRIHWKTFFQSLLKEKYGYEYTKNQNIILDYMGVVTNDGYT